MICNGNWVDIKADEELDEIIDQILVRDIWYAPRVGRKTMVTKDEVLNLLVDGGDIKYDNDWYDLIRMKKADPKLPANYLQAHDRKQAEITRMENGEQGLSGDTERSW